jgi:hypothetical protein
MASTDSGRSCTRRRLAGSRPRLRRCGARRPPRDASRWPPAPPARGRSHAGRDDADDPALAGRPGRRDGRRGCRRGVSGRHHRARDDVEMSVAGLTRQADRRQRRGEPRARRPPRH